MVKKRPNPVRSAAARKGWRTRQAQERQRSEASRQGWVTRRKNEKRKARARKLVARPSKPVARGRSRSMWAVTVAAPYMIRGKTRKSKGKQQDSPASAAYMVQGWYRTEKEARAARRKLVGIAERGREHAVAANPRAWSDDIEPDVEIKKVPYDSTKIGTIEETDEH